MESAHRFTRSRALLGANVALNRAGKKAEVEPEEQPEPNVDLASYDTIIVAFSGGKDSLACLLILLDRGVDPSKIELWHHDVDGREGSKLMDWPVTRDYVQKLADAFGVKVYYSWKVGGFEGEMQRSGTPTALSAFETPEGLRYAGKGEKGPIGTRLRFPQVSKDLSVRWCSAYLKIDVGAIALRNQDRFDNKRTLFITGERAQESPGRANYRKFETHRSDNRGGRVPRYIDHWRPVHGWSERQVWAIIERYGVNPHPAYRLGWGRVSCAACIYATGSPDQLASLRVVNPEQFAAVADYEQRFGTTIARPVVTKKSGKVFLSLHQIADKGKPYPSLTEADETAALSGTFDEPVILPPGEWKIPPGAYSDSCGPE